MYSLTNFLDPYKIGTKSYIVMYSYYIPKYVYLYFRYTCSVKSFCAANKFSNMQTAFCIFFISDIEQRLCQLPCGWKPQLFWEYTVAIIEQ